MTIYQTECCRLEEEMEVEFLALDMAAVEIRDIVFKIGDKVRNPIRNFITLCQLIEVEMSNKMFMQSSDKRSIKSQNLSCINKQWNKEQVWPFFGCCSADSQTDAGRHQLYSNGSLVLFSTAW